MTPAEKNASTAPATRALSGENAERSRGDSESRQTLDDDRRSPAKNEPPRPGEIAIRGRLVDANAHPLAGRTIGFFRGTAAAGACEREGQSASDGSFELSLAPAAGSLRIHEAGWKTVLAPVFKTSPQSDALIVAAPEIPMGGRVVDEFGRAVEGAEARIVLPASFRTRFSERNDSAEAMFKSHRSDAQGRFHIPEACFVEGAELCVVKIGFEQLKVPVPRNGNAALELRMSVVKRADDTISGQVIDSFGKVVADAWVTLGLSSTQSDGQGNFTVRIPEKGPNDILLAVKKGSLPARLTRPAASNTWPADIVLQLGGTPLSIEGRVVDETGAPVKNARVWIFDGAFAGRIDNTTSTVQGLVLGCATRSDLMKMIRESGEKPRAVLDRTSTAMWPFVRSGPDGRFKIEGLTDRTFTLRAMDDNTLLMTEASGVRAGSTETELRFPKDAYYQALAGRVVSKRGRPIANASIVTMCDPAVVEMGEGRSTQHRTAQRGRTDKDGKFRFKKVPRNLVYIRVDHDNILPIEFGRRNAGGLAALIGQDTSNVIIEVDARAHFQVELADTERADSFAMLDAKGKELIVNQFQGRSRSERRRQALHDGKSGVVVVAETATKLVLYKGTEIVDESAVNLVLGEVNKVRR